MLVLEDPYSGEEIGSRWRMDAQSFMQPFSNGFDECHARTFLRGDGVFGGPGDYGQISVPVPLVPCALCNDCPTLHPWGGGPDVSMTAWTPLTHQPADACRLIRLLLAKLSSRYL